MVFSFKSLFERRIPFAKLSSLNHSTIPKNDSSDRNRKLVPGMGDRTTARKGNQELEQKTQSFTINPSSPIERESRALRPRRVDCSAYSNLYLLALCRVLPNTLPVPRVREQF